jgi:hypothetical protein
VIVIAYKKAVKFEVGDRVKLIKAKETKNGLFTAGTIMLITAVTDSGYELVDRQKHTLKTGFVGFEKVK